MSRDAIWAFLSGLAGIVFAATTPTGTPMAAIHLIIAACICLPAFAVFSGRLLDPPPPQRKP